MMLLNGTMKRYFRFFLLLVGLLSARLVHAELAFGNLVTTLPYDAGSLLADPARNRIYATIPSAGTIVVIDTSTLQAVATIRVGPTPKDMAISPDGKTLFVANSDSAAAAISVVDLNTLTMRTSFPLPGPAVAVVVGLDGRVYATAIFDEGQSSEICQFDGMTGNVQATFANLNDSSGRLQISPDGKTLFGVTTYNSPGSLFSFDVSTAMATPLQTLSQIYARGSTMVLSHDGKYLGLSETILGPIRLTTGAYLFSTADITFSYGSYDLGDYLGVMAFCPDDSRAYVIHGNFPPALDVFDTATFVKLGSVPVPLIDTIDYGDNFRSIVTDSTGSYVFMADSVDTPGTYNGRIVVLSTGVSSLSAPLPTVSMTTNTTSIPSSGSDGATVTFTRTGDLSKKLAITYLVKGKALNGTDYYLLSGQKNIKAGNSSASVKIVPSPAWNSALSKSVRLILQPTSKYQLGDATQVKVKIYLGF